MALYWTFFRYIELEITDKKQVQSKFMKYLCYKFNNICIGCNYNDVLSYFGLPSFVHEYFDLIFTC